LILEPIYQTSGEWQKLIGVTEILIAHEEDHRRRVELRHRIAELYETDGRRPESSFEAYAAALGEDAADSKTQDNLERLARNLGIFERLARSTSVRPTRSGRPRSLGLPPRQGRLDCLL